MPKKSNKSAVEIKELSESELQKLAHEGTGEAMEKINKYIESERDFEKKSYAEMALEECEMFYYQPKNEKEEREFMLCKLIRRREENIDDMMMEIEKLELTLEKSALEGKVHENVLAKHKNKKEEWKYNWTPDFVNYEKNELPKIKENIAYDEAWVAEAKKMITTARYKNIPARHLKHYDFNMGDGFENDVDFDCDDDCCENE